MSKKSQAAEILDRIDRRLTALKMSESAAGAKAGSRDLIRSVRRGVKDGTQTGVKTDTLKKLAPVLETTAIWLLTGMGQEDLNKPSSRAADGSAGEAQVRMARVIGEVAAGRWEEAVPFADPDLPPDFDTHPPVPYVNDQRYQGLNQFAVRVAGTSVDKKIPDGFFAVCVRYFDARRELTEGDFVVVQRTRDGLYEGTIKQLAKGKNGWELWPRSNDPRHQNPVPYKDKKGEVEIIGLVIWQVGPV